MTKKNFYQFFVFTFFILLALGSSEGDFENEKIVNNVYYSQLKLNIDAGSTLLFGRASTYGYIVEKIWELSKENPNLTGADVQLIVSGDNGYGKYDTFDWCHLRFSEYHISELRKYEKFQLSYNEIGNILEEVGMSKMKDYKGDLSKEAFGK
jgi:hypothetical protein